MCEKGMWLTAVNEATGTSVLFKTRCKLWSCNDCRKINSDLWLLRATYGAHLLQESGQDIHLVTVTAHERHRVKDAVSVLPSAWNKLRSRWQRSGDKPEYMLIPEVGARGHFHVHLITNAPRGTRWWKDTARSCGFGYSNDESDRFINSAKAGFYVGKYLAKQLTQNVWKKGFHRVRVSRGWAKLPPLPKAEDWRFLPFPKGASVVSVLRNLTAQNYHVAVSDDRSSWDYVGKGRLTDGTSWLTMLSPLTDAEGVENDGK